MNLHGVLNVESAYIVAEEEVEEVIKEDKKEEKKETKKDTKKDDKDKDPDVFPYYNPLLTKQAMDAEPTPPPQTRKVKKQVRKAELAIVGGGLSLDSALKETYKEREAEMTVADKLIADTEDRKNALEEYIYDTRGKLDDIYADYASEEEKSKFREMLDAAEVCFRFFDTTNCPRNGYTTKAKMPPRTPTSPRWKNSSR